MQALSDDGFIIHKFAGCLRASFIPIQLKFEGNEFKTIRINDNTFVQIFDPKQFKCTNKDIGDYYDLRQGKKQMVKLRICKTKKMDYHKFYAFIMLFMYHKHYL